jgi:hypothetical protein
VIWVGPERTELSGFVNGKEFQAAGVSKGRVEERSGKVWNDN